MASYVGETTTNVENTDALINSKNANAEKSKIALIDVKNANALSSGDQKSALKKVHVEIEKDEDEEEEFASSKYARNMNPYDESEPPKPPSYDFEEFTQIKNEDEFPVPPSLPSSPILNSTGYFSLDNSYADEENHFPSSNHYDTETSDLDQSVFELELDSEDERIMDS